jgi:hypothetical protein
MVVKRKISNLNHPAQSLVTILTDV